MKVKTKIIPEGKGFVGCVLVNNELVYTSPVYSDTRDAVKDVNNYAANTDNFKMPQTVSARLNLNRPNLASTQPIQNNNNQNYVPMAKRNVPPDPPRLEDIPYTAPTPRKCCGRG